ncbi:MAG: hypothetical protein U0411_06065 [Thermodesulfovibrionales bacterium]
MKRLFVVFFLFFAGTGLVSGEEKKPGEAAGAAGKEAVVESLEEVVVTGSREAEPLKEKPQTAPSARYGSCRARAGKSWTRAQWKR